ncbi:methyl-accepting chemotaxis protein [Paenibacillus elgii]|uniref:methyl-accepting chemotaxis protein n=1 Tax=Paenibacillus elgii TaxID=189691 RepID=UPI000248D1CB|nr:methyl-accepting chemotaxis protein [Paenibacillus elgii]
MKLAGAMTLRQKLIAGLSAMVVLFMGVALFNVNQMHRIKSQLGVQNEKVELKLMALELKEVVQELNIIASGLEISKNPDYIPKYNEKRKLYDQMVQRIGETADTDEKSVWRSKLILLTGEYTNTFDVAAKVVQDKSLTKTDVDKNMEYLYNESQRIMGEIFTYVDHFYVSYAGDATAAVTATQDGLDRTVAVMITAFALVAVCVTAIGVLVIRSFTGQIRRLQHAVGRIADGDLRHKIGSRSRDELGQLSQSFDHMVDQVRGMLHSTKQIASSLAGHSLSFREFSGSTAAANQDILRAIQDISTGAEQQAHYSEHSAYLINSLAEEIRKINEYTDTMQRKSREAAFNTHTGSRSMEALRQSADRSGDVLRQVTSAMETLSQSSVQIGKIVGTITEIATQTNVLALNASIEAARAGEHGKGFSVIAEEVRQLSSQTAESSKRIGLIVKSLLIQMSEMEASFEEARRSFDEQNGKMDESVEAFSSIRSSMDELSGHIGQIHELITDAQEKNGQLVDAVQHVAAIAQESAAGVEEVNSSSHQQDTAIRHIASQADDMLSLTRRLFEEIDKFKIDDIEAEEAGEAEIPLSPEMDESRGQKKEDREVIPEAKSAGQAVTETAAAPAASTDTGTQAAPQEQADHKDNEAVSREEEEKKLQPV